MGMERRTNWLRRAIDALVAIAVAGPVFLAVGLRIITLRSRTTERRMFVFDVAHSLRSIHKSGHLEIIRQRALGGYFEQVTVFHPVGGSDPNEPSLEFTGLRRRTEVEAGHVFVEGKMAGIGALKSLPLTNFLVTQALAIGYACKIVKREGVSVLRGAEPFLTGPYAYLVARLTGRPFTLRIGSNFDELAKNGLLANPRLLPSAGLQSAVARFIFPRCDLIIAANENYRQYVLANGGRMERTVVVPYGSLMDAAHFLAPEDRGPLPERLPFQGRPFGIAVGRLAPVKYPVDLLEAARRIKERVPSAAIAMVGDGELLDELEELLREMGLEETVYFLGRRDQAWLARVYPHATAYLSPLAGRSLSEAALAQIPLIAYDTDWHSEIVRPGETGSLVGFRDWRAMADAFCEMCEKPEVAACQGRAARKLGLKMMGKEAVLQKELGAYRWLLEGEGEGGIHSFLEGVAGT